MILDFQRLDITLRQFDVENALGDPSKFRNVVYVDFYEDNIKKGELKLADKETLRLDGRVNVPILKAILYTLLRKPIVIKEHKEVVG